MRLKTILFNVWFYAVLTITTIFFALFFFPVVFLPAAWRYRSRWHYTGASLVGHIVLWAARIKLTVTGKKKLAKLYNNPSIIVLNHQSAFDIALSEALLWDQPRIVFSNDYPFIPFFGIVLRRMHVIVKRLTTRNSQQSLDDAMAITRPYANHIVIFPEGTRHTDGSIHKFYRGFTILAEQLNRPITPIFLHGMHKVMIGRSYFFNPEQNKVTVVVGDPLVFQPALESREEFLEKVHNWFTLECSKVNQNS